MIRNLASNSPDAVKTRINCAFAKGTALEAGESVVAKSLLGQLVASASRFFNESHVATELITACTTRALAGGVGRSRQQFVGLKFR